MRVDVWSDVVCPWCYVGKARFEKALRAFGRPIGNTFDIHRVIHFGRENGVQLPLISAINEAYFAQARQVFDRDVICDVASGAGLEYNKVGEVVDGDAYADAVHQDERLARDLGITGVPFFVFDMALAVSGAQSPETFASALNQTWAGRG
jgi:predicted DsbA family dithiol-disulfide isomerase